MIKKQPQHNKAHLFTNQDLISPETLSLEHGQVIVYSHSNILTQSINEDSAGVIRIDPQHTLLVVADGLGGHSDGAKASKYALENLSKHILNSKSQNDDIQSLIINSLEESNNTINSWKNGAATTIAIAEIYLQQVRTYHAGDSEILLCGLKGKNHMQTISHSPVGYAVESGLITEEEAMIHPDRHFISNFIGSETMHITVSALNSMKSKDTLLLATDGVYDNLTKQEIINTIRKGPLDNAAENLKQKVQFQMKQRDRSIVAKPDDMTFILFRQNK